MGPFGPCPATAGKYGHRKKIDGKKTGPRTSSNQDFEVTCEAPLNNIKVSAKDAVTWHAINVAVNRANLLAFAAIGGDGSPGAISSDLARRTVWLRALQCEEENRVPLAGQLLQHPSEAYAFIADQHQAAAARQSGNPNATWTNIMLGKVSENDPTHSEPIMPGVPISATSGAEKGLAVLGEQACKAVDQTSLAAVVYHLMARCQNNQNIVVLRAISYIVLPCAPLTKKFIDRLSEEEYESIGDLFDEDAGLFYPAFGTFGEVSEIGIEVFKTIATTYEKCVLDSDSPAACAVAIAAALRKFHPGVLVPGLNGRTRGSARTAKKFKRASTALTSLTFMEVADYDGFNGNEYAFGKGGRGAASEYNRVVNDMVHSGILAGPASKYTVSEDAPADGDWKRDFGERQPKRQMLRQDIAVAIKAMAPYGDRPLTGIDTTYLGVYKTAVPEPPAAPAVPQ